MPARGGRGDACASKAITGSAASRAGTCICAVRCGRDRLLSAGHTLEQGHALVQARQRRPRLSMQKRDPLLHIAHRRSAVCNFLITVTDIGTAPRTPSRSSSTTVSPRTLAPGQTREVGMSGSYAPGSKYMNCVSLGAARPDISVPPGPDLSCASGVVPAAAPASVRYAGPAARRGAPPRVSPAGLPRRPAAPQRRTLPNTDDVVSVPLVPGRGHLLHPRGHRHRHLRRAIARSCLMAIVTAGRQSCPNSNRTDDVPDQSKDLPDGSALGDHKVLSDPRPAIKPKPKPKPKRNPGPRAPR